MVTTEQPRGMFGRQLFVGDNLDADKISADYPDGGLRLMFPAAEKAAPRHIEISHDGHQSAVGQRLTVAGLQALPLGSESGRGPDIGGRPNRKGLRIDTNSDIAHKYLHLLGAPHDDYRAGVGV